MIAKIASQIIATCLKSSLVTLACAFLLFTCKQRNKSSHEKAVDRSPAAIGFAADYAKECSDGGVVLPLSIQNKSFWSIKEPIHTEFPHFAAGDSPGDLYSHLERDGSGCLELVTNGLDTSFSHFGQERFSTFAICWSKAGHVCFWEHNGQEPIVAPVSSIDQATPMAQINNNCLKCHRGDNPFVGHSEGGDPTFSKFPQVVFRRPIVPSEWLPSEGWESSQNGDDSYQCSGGCHSIPKLHGKEDPYCKLAISMNEAGLMLGRELGIKNPHRPQEAKEKSGHITNDLQEKCRLYQNFLLACGVEIKNGNIGVCSQMGPSHE